MCNMQWRHTVEHLPRLPHQPVHCVRPSRNWSGGRCVWRHQAGADVIGKRRMRHRLFMEQCGQDQKHSPNRVARSVTVTMQAAAHSTAGSHSSCCKDN